ncbi:hypothetical protein GF373_16200 [bacterium]|nr:hypothetical protein [bacterium]
MNLPLVEEERWKRVNRFIETILSDEESCTMIAPIHSHDNAEQAEKDRAEFLKAVQRGCQESARGPSMIEQWVLAYQQQDWLAAIYAKMNALKAKATVSHENLTRFFAPLLQAIDDLSGSMQPAPAYRTASPTAAMVFQPRRRELEPADLPVFNPLFCTSVTKEKQPTVIYGLEPQQEYMLTLHTRGDTEPPVNQSLLSSDQGTLTVNLYELAIPLTENPSEGICWLLSENGSLENGAWSSGLIWLESEKQTEDMYGIYELLGNQAAQNEVDLLLSINISIARGRYIEAYEEARRSLLFQPKEAELDHSVPLRECLWQLINQILDKMVQKLEPAGPRFRQMKKEWDAITPLQQLQEQIRGRN